MRIVAIAILALLVTTGLPVGAADRLSTSDECYNEIRPEEGPTCLRFKQHEKTPGAVSDETGRHYFLWLEAVDCRSGTVCSSWVLPSRTKNAFAGTPAVVGLLYGDTNGILGLQRTGYTSGGEWKNADDAILA